jgi:hypothetical protein
MLVNTFLASLAAKLAMATGLVVATVTAAGAAGVLPEPAQNAVASVVEATTPFAVPHAAADEVVKQVVGDVTTTTLGTSTTLAGRDADENEGDGTTGATRKENHGACVSTVAKNTPGGPDKGKTVSSVARSDCGKTSSTTVTTVAPTTSSTTATTVAPTTSSTVAGLTSSKANSGKGNSGNSANSGKGNSGKN